MRSNFLLRTRKWIGASALAILVGIGGGTAFVAGSSQMATAQAVITPAAQIGPVTPVQAPGFADLVDAVKPAVVSIVVEGREQGNQLDDQGQQFNDQIPDLPDPFKRFFNFGQGGNDNGNGAPGRGGQQGDNGPGGKNGGRGGNQGPRFAAAGSGFVISGDGYIVTNNHVVENASKVTVTFSDGTSKPAKVIGVDKRTDLAVVKVDGSTDLPFVKLAEDSPRVGDWVVAVGNPFGLGGTVTAGIVSALGRDVAGSQYGDFMQIDAAVNMGNSGGPTFNMKGEVVGVNTEIFSPNGGNVGIAFAIPAKTVQQITSSLIKSGTVTRGYLGVSIQDVTSDIANSVGLKDAKGALVTTLSDGSPGGKAGLKSGDIITKVNDIEIDNSLALSRTIASMAPGTVVQLTVWRDNKEQTFSATLDTYPADTDQPNQPTPPDQNDQTPMQSSTGMTLVPNGNGQGVLVQDVDPDSVAADKGFAVGDAILEVNNQKVSTPKQFEDAIKSVRDSGKTSALIKAERGDRVLFFGLPLDQAKN